MYDKNYKRIPKSDCCLKTVTGVHYFCLYQNNILHLYNALILTKPFFLNYTIWDLH